LQATGDDMLAAEAAGHWAAAGRVAEELPSRVRAAEAAERVFGYAEAARHWQRAVELFARVPVSERLAGIDLPQLYVRAIDALNAVGDTARGGVLAEEAYRRFADHPDPAAAASIHLRAAWFRFDRSSADARPLYEQALRLFEQVPPSVDHAKAWFSYAGVLFHAEGQEDARRAALARGLEVAEAAGATGVAAVIQLHLAHDACLRGRVAEGFAIIDRARALAEASGSGEAVLDVAWGQSDILLKTGRFDEAAEAGLRSLQAARESGRYTDTAAVNAAEAMLARGHTAQAAQLIDPLTDAPADPDHYQVHELRAEIDLLRGDVAAATEQLRQIRSVAGRISSIDHRRDFAERAADVAVWAGQPLNGLAEVRDALARYVVPDLTILCGWLLALGMRACADLAEHGRALRDESATQAALAAAGALVVWVDQMDGAPFADHPYMATIPAARATWDAERTRLAGASDPAAWHAAAKTWEDLGCPHRAGYAWWRHAEARLLAGQPPHRRRCFPSCRGRRRRRARTPAVGDPRARRARPHSTRHPASHGPAAARGGRPVRAHRARAAGAAPAGSRSYQSADRCGVVHQPEDGQRPRDQNLAQARRLHPGAGRRSRRTRRPARSLLRRIRRHLRT
jgi:tetratricopeptide (TPR) repeat protein